MQRKHVQVTVYAMYRLKNSKNGNPRYRLSTNQGELLTSSDHSFVYGINNAPWTDYEKSHGKYAQINLTRAGRIEHLEWI